MNVPEITEVKNHLEKLKNEGFISDWELPYENLLTRRSAAIFFIEPASNDSLGEVWSELNQYKNFLYRKNSEKELSQMAYRITFNPEEVKNTASV